MGASGFILLLVMGLFAGTALLALGGASALDRGRARMVRLGRQIEMLVGERDDRTRIRDRAAELVRVATQTVRELEAAIEAAQAEMDQLRDRPPTPVHLASRRIEPSWAIYIAKVTATHGFDATDEGGAEANDSDQGVDRHYAGPAPDMSAFLHDLASRFPEEAGYRIGPAALFMPAAPGARSMVRRPVH